MITFYSRQRVLIERKLRESGLTQIQVKTVDGFQVCQSLEQSGVNFIKFGHFSLFSFIIIECCDHSNSLEVDLASKLQIPNICKTPQELKGVILLFLLTFYSHHKINIL